MISLTTLHYIYIGLWIVVLCLFQPGNGKKDRPPFLDLVRIFPHLSYPYSNQNARHLEFQKKIEQSLLTKVSVTVRSKVQSTHLWHDASIGSKILSNGLKAIFYHKLLDSHSLNKLLNDHTNLLVVAAPPSRFVSDTSASSHPVTSGGR